MTYTLGLAIMDNSAAALFHRGTLVAAVEEERLSRVKNDGAFPHLAIAEVLSIARITLADVADVAVYWQPWRLRTRLLGTLRKLASGDGARRAVMARASAMFGRGNAQGLPEHGSWSDLFRLRRILQNRHGPCTAKLHFIDHHLTHQIYAEAMRDWDDCVSLSYDGGGEEHSTILAILQDGKRSILSRHRWPNSLGHFYSVFTGFLGFKMLEGEYKMMGLAPYGMPVFRDAILREILTLAPGGRYRMNTKVCDYHSALKGQFHPRLTELFGPAVRPGQDPTETHVNLAASVQAAFEDAQAHVLALARKRCPDLTRLVISGGCALNVTANGRLLQSGQFDEIIIPPAPHDAGCAVGAAMAVLGDAPDRDSIRAPYLGRAYDQQACHNALTKRCKAVSDPLPEEELINQTAGLLSEGRIIAWFHGRSEFGPRALGCRSFLADPRNDSIREELNTKIKKRELFRPFAPSTIEEAASDIFELDQPSPYMNIVARVRDSRKDDVPAITHTDQTARVHTVSKAANPRYHALIKRFGELTGVRVVLNTSFNIQEPIVYSPEQALDTFAASGVDALVLEDFVVTRELLK